MNYKMLALDLDNTLFGRDLTIPPDTLGRLKGLIDRGILVTLSTGRMFPSARKYARELGIKLPLVCYNGALIQSADGRGFRLSRPVPVERMKEVLDFCRANHHYVQLYREDKIVVERLVDQTHRDPDLLNAPCVEVGDFSQMEPFESPKLLMVVPPQDAPGIRQALRRQAGELYLAASGDNLIEIMRADVSKANALQLLCRELGVSREEVVCCGDNSNDAEMIQWAGLGVAVGNAIPEVKQIADYVCAHPCSQGVSEVVDRFF